MFAGVARYLIFPFSIFFLVRVFTCKLRFLFYIIKYGAMKDEMILLYFKYNNNTRLLAFAEALVHRCSTKQLLQNSQEAGRSSF